MVEKLVCFALGFATGSLYASYKYDKNPNELIDHSKEDIAEVTEKARNMINEGKDAIASKMNNGKKEEIQPAEKVDAEVVL